MKIQLAKPEHIDAWMVLVEQVRNAFPGLEIAEAMAEHRPLFCNSCNLLPPSARWMRETSWVLCCSQKGKQHAVLSGGGSRIRRQHIARQMVDFMLTQWRLGRTSPSPPTGRAIPTESPPVPSTSAWGFLRAS